LGSLVVTHPFHPLCGRRLEVLAERRGRAGRSYVCDAGELGWVEFEEDATDRGRGSAERRLSFEVLVELVAVVASLSSAASEGTDR
jgi:hypothetical protein